MPTKPPTFRPPGMQSRREQKRDHDRRRRRQKPWRAWYNTAAWQSRRAAQLTSKPYCERHDERGELVLATVANHRQPHRGDWDLFIGGALESLCKHCHDSEVQREERARGEGDQKSGA